jgi:hypothetical protein
MVKAREQVFCNRLNSKLYQCWGKDSWQSVAQEVKWMCHVYRILIQNVTWMELWMRGDFLVYERKVLYFWHNCACAKLQVHSRRNTLTRDHCIQNCQVCWLQSWYFIEIYSKCNKNSKPLGKCKILIWYKICFNLKEIPKIKVLPMANSTISSRSVRLT